MSTQMTQEKLIMYKHLIYNQSLFINQTDVIQNLEFADQLPIFTLKVNFSIGVLFDRVPTKITNLQFTNSPRTNFTGFEQMKQLMILSLYDNQLSQINFISSLINLTNLNVCSNIIKDLSPLQNLIQLKEINLNFNKIQDISPLKKLVKLEIIHINSNQIIDIHPLTYLKELTQLYIRQNKIITIKPLQSLSKLKVCNFNINLIQDQNDIHYPIKPLFEDNKEDVLRDLFDKEDKIQFKPTTQQLHFQNKITAVYEQQDKLLQQCQRIKTATLSIKQKQTRTRQLLADLEEAQVYWSSRVATLFQAMNGVTSQ
ncbi:leucine-rich_repeat domain-containing protein [Hexamita inflata]|uniref:Leucine-rich_repeat domain-containing protein n=1 Tax=Hexamita inflata TaxID=28002 RepID=A0ABP1GED6_9EUKA